MISWKDLPTVLKAVIPLYVAMILAYGSIRWWKIFLPDQYSGINRFVAIFTVPLIFPLFFHQQSVQNELQVHCRRYTSEDYHARLLMVWTNFTRNESLEWMITIFSLSTLHNTLVIGIPLLIAMYGQDSVPWCQDPDHGAVLEDCRSILSFKVDSDVVSLHGREFLETDAEIVKDGKLHVTLRKSNTSRRSFAMTPRPSNLTSVEIYKLKFIPESNAQRFEFQPFRFLFHDGNSGVPRRQSNFGPVDLYPVQSSRGPTPRPSNFEENCIAMSLQNMVISLTIQSLMKKRRSMNCRS
ncbi:hypothetical protein SLEP1_g47184 [Rubroshorea leprosula]|uniref:Uncharacterized protein n=1 Tax=Rubroshorea leprosula TaxID=152421 RepID=A0AAV5LQK4_9ROSI|nr:hypothetical protein SLEP1_g47184 [Rubroshorea leprosula]